MNDRSANTLPLERTAAPPPLRPGRPLSDGLVLTRRNLVHAVREPAESIIGLVMPMVIALLFGYVFGEAMAPDGDAEAFRAFVMPGIFVMVMINSVAATASGVADDTRTAVMGRFRSMPMASSALLTGRAAADMLKALAELAILLGCGLLIGWRWEEGPVSGALALALLLLFRFAMVWVGIYLGLLTRDPQLAGVIVYPLAFPLSVLSTTFIDPALMPGPLGAVAEWSPISAAVDASRELFGNPGLSGGDSWGAENPVPAAVLWSAAILLLAVPASVRRFRSLRD